MLYCFACVLLFILLCVFTSCSTKRDITASQSTMEMQHIESTDSIRHKSETNVTDSSRTEETEIVRRIEYDTSVSDSDGRHPVKTVTITTRHKGKQNSVKSSTKSDTKMTSGTTSDSHKSSESSYQEHKKSEPQLKQASCLIRNICVLIVLLTIIFLCIRYRVKIAASMKNIRTFVKNRIHL